MLHSAWVCSHSVVSDSWLPKDCSPQGSSVRGIIQARILEWVAISSSRGSFQPRNQSTSPSASALVGGFFNTEQPGKLHSRTFYLSILDILVCICDLETPNPSLSCHSYPLTTTFVFSLCLWICFCFVDKPICGLVSTYAAAKSLQSCQILCDPIDSSPPGSPVPGILQARTLEWVAISFSNAWKWQVKVKSLSRARPSATP